MLSMRGPKRPGNTSESPDAELLSQPAIPEPAALPAPAARPSLVAKVAITMMRILGTAAVIAVAGLVMLGARPQMPATVVAVTDTTLVTAEALSQVPESDVTLLDAQLEAFAWWDANGTFEGFITEQASVVSTADLAVLFSKSEPCTSAAVTPTQLTDPLVVHEGPCTRSDMVAVALSLLEK